MKTKNNIYLKFFEGLTLQKDINLRTKDYMIGQMSYCVIHGGRILPMNNTIDVQCKNINSIIKILPVIINYKITFTYIFLKKDLSIIQIFFLLY